MSLEANATFSGCGNRYTKVKHAVYKKNDWCWSVCVAPDPRTLWLGSPRSFTGLQCRIRDLKATGIAIRAIQEIVRNLLDAEQENAAVGLISTSCIHSSLRRTAMGRCSTPH
jgi:hypothetical protein